LVAGVGRRFVTGSRIPTLSIRLKHVRVLDQLPILHKDPFDRLLVAQALGEGVALVTKDARLKDYGVRVIW
jgi:PIN domain nuclease of toxin-antitoxin system